MARPKNDGQGRIAGRKKGTPNKMTKERRELIAKFLDDNFEEFMYCWQAIDDPYKKCCIYNDMIPFATPKLQSIELNNQANAKSFEQELDELEGKKT